MMKVMNITPIEKLNYLKAYKIQYQTKSGNIAEWELVSRGDQARQEAMILRQESVSDGAVIFAVDKERCRVVMLKEYRVSAGRYLFMLPAGLGDEGEDPFVTAEREFKEETGLDFEPVTADRERYVSVGIVDEKISIVYGYYSGEPSKSGQADNEDAEIVFVDREEAKRLLEQEEVTLRSALLLQYFFGLNPFFSLKTTKNEK